MAMLSASGQRCAGPDEGRIRQRQKPEPERIPERGPVLWSSPVLALKGPEGQTQLRAAEIEVRLLRAGWTERAMATGDYYTGTVPLDNALSRSGGEEANRGAFPFPSLTV